MALLLEQKHSFQVPDVRYEVEKSANGGYQLVRICHDGCRITLADQINLAQAKRLMLLDSDPLFRES